MTFCRLVWLIACLYLVPSLASADVYRCTESGKTVYSDKPCVGDLTKVPIQSAPLPPARAAPVNLQYEADMGRVALGMTTLQVEEAWGKAAETSRQKDGRVTTQRWTYIRNGDATDIFFQDGFVSEISGPGAVATSTPLPDEPPRSTAADPENQNWLDEEQERLEKSDERRFIRDGMTHEQVRHRIGPPAIIRVDGPEWGIATHWIYPPTPNDPQTTTDITFNHDGGYVYSVRRVVTP
jgi:hypothetical protein